VRCTGRAPEGLRFALGLRPGHPPLVRYDAREVREPRESGAQGRAVEAAR
jgi:hypothetical protein